MHFYFMLGAIPIAVGVTVANVLQGPAVLKPIPEGTHSSFLNPPADMSNQFSLKGL